MDVALLFFLPLLGGYIFVRGFLFTRHRTAREETARVYYRAAVAGVVLSLCGLLLHTQIKAANADYRALAADADTYLLTPLFDKSEAPAANAAPSSQREFTAKARGLLAAACFWALLLGLLTPLWNRIALLPDGLWIATLWLLRKAGWRPRKTRLSPIERVNRRAIVDELERLFYVAMVRTDAVQVSLDNDKVYVGIVTSIDPVGPAKHFTMQPMMSGGRNGNDRDVVYTSFYDKIIADVKGTDPAQREELLQRLGLVVPLSRIVTASGFDFDVYKRFALARASAKPRYRLDATGRPVQVNTTPAAVKANATGS